MASEQLASFGGGCFWCTEAVFKNLRGVIAVTSGYMGGSKANPTYREVCSGRTGHAEMVQIRFDPDQIGYDQLLDVHMVTHDPTQLNRQGADVGTQYRSVIFYHSPEQEEAAHAAKARADQLWDDPVVTEIAPADTFWPAEDYHQDYLEKNSMQPYCMAVVAPKVSKARRDFRHLMKDAAA